MSYGRRHRELQHDWDEWQALGESHARFESRPPEGVILRRSWRRSLALVTSVQTTAEIRGYGGERYWRGCQCPECRGNRHLRLAA